MSLALFTLKWWVSTLTAFGRPWRPRRKAAHSLPGTCGQLSGFLGMHLRARSWLRSSQLLIIFSV